MSRSLLWTGWTYLSMTSDPPMQATPRCPLVAKPGPNLLASPRDERPSLDSISAYRPVDWRGGTTIARTGVQEAPTDSTNSP